jgi:hypothetical protein
MIRIQSDGQTGYGTRVTTADGQPIPGVQSIDIQMGLDSLTTAKMRIIVGAVDVMAHPLLDLDTIKEAAQAHGFVLVPENV